MNGVRGGAPRTAPLVFRPLAYELHFAWPTAATQDGGVGPAAL